MAKVRETKTLEHILNKKNTEIDAITQQNEDLVDTLRKKEGKIYEYKHQLKDLKKTEHNLEQMKAEI